MSTAITGKKFNLLATRCGSCSCGCPTIFESEDGESVVIVGSVDEITANVSAIREKTGAGEAAVVIPKSLLLEAAKQLG
jgi:hypothetical protein